LILVYINQSHQIANRDCRSLPQYNKPKFNAIPAKMSRGGILSNSKNFQRLRDLTIAKIIKKHQNTNWNS
jgi:hypothetical protein